MEMCCVFTNDNSNDILIWEPSASGTYSTKSTFSWLTLMSNPPHIQTMAWSWIWILKLLENIHHFVWIIMHGKLSTNYRRVTHHMSTDALCHNSGACNETILHSSHS